MLNKTLGEEIYSYPLFQYSVAMFILWIMNFFMIWILYYYNISLNRLKISRWINFRLFNQKFFDVIIDEAYRLWLPFLTQYFDNPDDLGKINDRTRLTLKTSLLEFAVENGHFHLAKVLIQS